MQQIEPIKLTTRQRQVLVHLLTGIGEKRIAYSLNISVHTVHTHVRGIYAAFAVHSLAELMSLFLQEEIPMSHFIET